MFIIKWPKFDAIFDDTVFNCICIFNVLVFDVINYPPFNNKKVNCCIKRVNTCKGLCKRPFYEI